MDNFMAKSNEVFRRKCVEGAIADSGMEGFPPPSHPEQRIHDAFVRDGDADKFMAAIKQMVQQKQLQP